MATPSKAELLMLLKNLEVQVLNELYAGSSEIGLIGRRWVDGMPVLEDAFARLITG